MKNYLVIFSKSRCQSAVLKIFKNIIEMVNGDFRILFV
jgi:hypothetical protein